MYSGYNWLENTTLFYTQVGQIWVKMSGKIPMTVFHKDAKIK